MVSLHAEADTASTEQEVERLLEEPRAVAVRHGAVVDPLIPAQNRLTPELKYPLAPQGPLVQHHPPGVIHVVDHRSKSVPVLGGVHPEDSTDLFRPSFPPPVDM